MVSLACPEPDEGNHEGQFLEVSLICICSKWAFFNCHTGESRYPMAEFNLKTWIPAFAGMTACFA
jgi:hypothetical protein